MKRFAISCAFLLITFKALACVNYSGSGTKFNGAWTSGNSIRPMMQLRRALSRDLSRDGVQMEAELRGSTNFNDRSDYSIALMYLFTEAKRQLNFFRYWKKNSRATTSSPRIRNGLHSSDNNEEAARWIAEGIRRNPESHEGTEWLHLKILRQKSRRKRTLTILKNIPCSI